MPLHLTKVAFGCESLAILEERIAARLPVGEVWLTTRYLPKRHAEIEGGSLFWILRHQLVARSPILGFGDAEGGRTTIRLAPQVILVTPRAKRAHQGWRYLEAAHAPADLGDSTGDGDALPAALAGRLADLALL